MQKRKLIQVFWNKKGIKNYIMECCFCKNPFIVNASRFNSGHNKFCNHSCSRKGTPSPNYKGRIKRSGYWYVRLPSHPSCKNKKQPYIAEHRLVMEKYIGRKLLNNEIVHHIDRNIINNKIENLILYKNCGEHVYNEHAITNTITGRFISKKSYLERLALSNSR